MPVSKRCFIAGCSRSGTTLLQRIMSAHSQVHTFPETGVFLKAWGMRHTMPSALLGLTSQKEIKVLRRLLAELPPESQFNLSKYSQGLLKNNTHHITASFDELCMAQNCSVWLEKTPRHFLHAKRFSRKIDNCTVFHVIRDGLDVVASIVDRSQKNPEKFAKQDIDYAIRLWNRAIRKQWQCMKADQHYFIPYEALAAQPSDYAHFICNTLDIAFEPKMLERPDNQGRYIKPTETWKSGINADIKPAISKADALFSKAQQQLIQSKLDYRKYHQLLSHTEETSDSFVSELVI